MKNILLIGNPNVGKTAILNQLSGSTYNIGNWAGVTVARQEGILTTDKEKFHILDLPGIYSLIPCSEDEHVSVQEIFTTNYDLIINIIDLNNLHQNLMLTAELLELGVPMIGVLNFCDEFDKNHSIDVSKMQDILGIPLVRTSAHTGEGFKELIHMISLTENYSSWISKLRIVDNNEYNNIAKLFPKATIRYTLSGIQPNIDPRIVYTYISLSHPILLHRFGLVKKEVEQIVEQNQFSDFLEKIIEKKEFLIQQIPVEVINKEKKDTIKIVDNILLHPIFGYGFFAVIMGVLFTMVFNAANPFIDFIDWLVGQKLTLYASYLLVDVNPILQSFIIDGLIGGVGGVMTFVPLIFILYIFLAVLEESGYLARIAILLEYPFSKIGLSGKSFFPMLLGFGCTVPAIYGSRVLETPALRRLTAMLSSLISCGARLPVYALFISAFFPENGGLILLSLYLLGIFLALIFAFIISKFPQFSSANSCFVMVLPNYRLPNFRIVFRKASLHASEYLKKAGGVILGMLMVIWAVSYFPAQGDISKSYMSKAGQVIQPIFEPLGFGDRWEPVVSIIPSLIAKESVVGFFGQILSNDEEVVIDEDTPSLSIETEILDIGGQLFTAIKSSFIGLFTWNFFEQFGTPSVEDLESEAGTGIISRLQQMWTDENSQAKAYSFMIFILLTLPCVAATGALKQELPTSYFFATIAFYIILPFLSSLIFYQIAILF